MQEPLEATDIVIIGGGFYGCSLALFLKQHYQRVIILEKESDLLSQASLVNQARVHQGYHYPRSYMTGLRSQINYKRFINDFPDCIDHSFEKIYAIAKQNSKVSSKQFVHFCNSIAAPLHTSSAKVKKLFNPQLIEDVFTVEEVAFNALILRDTLKSRLQKSRVDVRYNQEVALLSPLSSEQIVVKTADRQIIAKKVFNCTYNHINKLLKRSHINPLPIKYELAELALVQVPEQLKDIGVTIMDGPFFSIMPYPAKKLHSLSHVRYTPHYSWTDHMTTRSVNQTQRANQSNFVYMSKDAQRFIPELRGISYRESLYAIKSVLLRHEVDDGRPILHRSDHGIKNHTVIMGGKLDNIYDILALLEPQPATMDQIELRV